MFGMFKRRSSLPEPELGKEERQEIDQNLLFLLDLYCPAPNEKTKFLDDAYFEIESQEELTTPDILISKLAQHLQIKSEKLDVNFVDVPAELDWYAYLEQRRMAHDMDFTGNNSEWERRWLIQIPRKYLSSPAEFLVIATVELYYAYLYQFRMDRFVGTFEDDLDLIFLIYRGMGAYLVRSISQSIAGGVPDIQLPSASWCAYTMAAVSYLFEHESPADADLLQGEVRREYLRALDWLLEYEKTELVRSTVSEAIKWRHMYDQMMMLLEQHQFEAYIALCDTWKLHSSDSNLYNNSGFGCMVMGRHEEALMNLNRAIVLSDTNAYAFNNRGYVQLMRGQYDDAYTDIQTGLMLDSQDGFGWRNLGLYYISQQMWPEAEKALEDAKKINPETDCLARCFALLYEKTERPAAAKEMLTFAEERGEYELR